MAIAEEVHLDIQKFQACYADPSPLKIIEADSQEAQRTRSPRHRPFLSAMTRLVGSVVVTDGARAIERRFGNENQSQRSRHSFFPPRHWERASVRGIYESRRPIGGIRGGARNVQIVSPSLLTPLAIGLPYVEMWTGLFLLAGLYSRQAALLSTLLFASFLTVISAAFLRGIDLSSCGCFGSDILLPGIRLSWTSAPGSVSDDIQAHELPPPLSSIGHSESLKTSISRGLLAKIPWA